eukprot:6134909-Pleurochrysis_carterae.AAC.1
MSESARIDKVSQQIGERRGDLQYGSGGGFKFGPNSNLGRSRPIAYFLSEVECCVENGNRAIEQARKRECARECVRECVTKFVRECVREQVRPSKDWTTN